MLSPQPWTWALACNLSSVMLQRPDAHLCGWEYTRQSSCSMHTLDGLRDGHCCALSAVKTC